jgi:hypothetical protein
MDKLQPAFPEWHNNERWKDLPKQEFYLAKGGEARVFLHEDQKCVIKINDGNYYATWLEYFNS